MRAFVLSGGANRGALQAGAALALLDKGIKPDLIVASSVGAVNGACLAAQPTVEGVHRIAERWKTVGCDEIFPGNTATMAWRLLRGSGSLHDNRGLRRFILSLLPPNVRRFGDLQIPLLVTATKLSTGELHLFGDQPRERLLDGLMASCAVPPFLPPYEYGGELYIDGCFVSNLPISAAIERGATEVWALEIGTDVSLTQPKRTVFNTLSRSVDTLVRHQMVRERELARLSQQTGVTIHHVQMLHYSGIDCHDFRHSAKLMELGYETASAYLSQAPQRPTELTPPDVPYLDRCKAVLQQSLADQRRRVAQTAGQLRSLRLPRIPAGQRGAIPVPVAVESES